MQDSFLDPAAIERIRARISGVGYNAESYAADRMAAALEAKRRKPYFLVARMATGPTGGAGAGVLPNGVPINFSIPKNGLPRATAIYGGMTDAHLSTALFNIVRRRNLPVDVYEQSMLTNPQRALYFMGDMNDGANRIGPADWFIWPEAEYIEKGEPFNLIGQGDGANADVSKCFAVFYGEQEYGEETAEGSFSTEDRADILRQIQGREQVTSVVTFDVDYTKPATYTEVQLPILDRWALLLGFASGVDATGNYLRWSTVDVEGEREQRWSNEAMPISALMSLPFDTSNKQVFYRNLLTPYLIRPGDSRRLKFTFAARAATAGGDYPPSVTADTTGRIVAMIKTV